MLKAEAAEKKFPDNELLRKLNTVLKDIEHCQRTSTELLSDLETRYDGTQIYHLREMFSLMHLHFSLF